MTLPPQRPARRAPRRAMALPGHPRLAARGAGVALALFAWGIVPGGASAAGGGGLIVGRVDGTPDVTRIVLRQDAAGQAMVLRLAALELPPGQPAGAQAARAALRACTGGRTVVATVVETDRQGQPVAMLDAGGQDCGLQLLRRGLAVLVPSEADRLPVGDRHRYRRAEEEARVRRLGVWADAAPPPTAAPRPER